MEAGEVAADHRSVEFGLFELPHDHGEVHDGLESAVFLEGIGRDMSVGEQRPAGFLFAGAEGDGEGGRHGDE